MQNKTNHLSSLQKALLSPINLFQLYRFFLSIFILIAFFTESGPFWLGFFYPKLFAISSISFFGFVLASLMMTHFKTISSDNNIRLMIPIDILFITLLMHASGGVETGLGMLLAISVTAGSLMMRGRLALFFASLATVALISQQFATYFYQININTHFTQSALLGISFFAIALLSHSLALHIKASEKLAIETQKSLDSMAQLSEHVIAHMQEGVIAVDPKGIIKLINNAAWKLINKIQTQNEYNIHRICPSLGQELNKYQRDNISTDSLVVKIPDEENNNIEQKINVKFTALGATKNEGTLIFLEDLSTASQQAQQLKLASIGRLTASIAHEIRNPLGAISHAGQLLQESESLSPDDQRLTEIITNNSRRMNQVIENVLTLAKQDSANPTLISLKSWLIEISNKIIDSINLKPEQISIQVFNDNLQAYFDVNQIEQAFSILLSNSVRHFDQEIQNLSIELKASSKENQILLEVIDNGPGIAVEHLKNIFEPFYTSLNSGTGLGLYIARELIESNKGQISYTSILPRGSNFKLLLPIKIMHD